MNALTTQLQLSLALRAIRMNPCCAQAWAEARALAFHHGGTLTVEAAVLDVEGPSHQGVWDVVDVDLCPRQGYVLVLVEANYLVNRPLDPTMSADVRWEN